MFWLTILSTSLCLLTNNVSGKPVPTNALSLRQTGADIGADTGAAMGADTGAAVGSPMGAPEGAPEGAPMGAPEGAPMGAPEGAPEGAPMSTGTTAGASGPIYPQKIPQDPVYKVPEATLKAAVKVPAGFQPGTKMPVILVPGTGVTGTQTFMGNFQKLMADSQTMAPVPLDIPNNLLDDAQQNSEFVAYGINYMVQMSGGMNVSVVSWSQGGLDTQWVLKYWPSTRPVVSDFVAISPDLNGTTIGAKAEPVQGIIPLAPSLLQQEQDSVYVATMRANGGDSAIVPTTSVYSSADEIVQPQVGKTASAYFKEDNGVPASNYQVQVICGKDSPAGGNFTHEGVLYNSFAYAIAMDAMTNPGPGNAKRLDLKQVCSMPLAPGLTMDDKATTDATIKEAAGNILSYTGTGSTMANEPEIRAYAKKDVPKGAKSNGIGSTLGGLAGGLGGIL